MTLRRPLVSLVVVAALNATALVALLMSATTYRVDFTSVLEMWREVIADADRFGLAATAPLTKNEVAVGDEAIKFFAVLKGERRQAYLDAVGARVAAQAKRKGIPYRFHIVAMPQVNAFALPGGHILVTTGMLDFVGNEAQLAAVLAHEVAHVDLRHCIEQLQYQLLVEKALGDVLGKLAREAYDLAARGYSELKEREADRTGMIFMAEAGYSPIEAVTLFDRFDREIERSGAAAKRTQGPVGEVLVAVDEALRDYYVSHPSALQRMRDIDRLFDRNMASWRGRRFVVGRSNLRDLKLAEPDASQDETVLFSETDPAYLLARGRAETVAGGAGKAIDYLTRAVAAAPDVADAYRVRAEAYVKAQRFEGVGDDVRRSVALRLPELDALEVTARDSEAAGDAVAALAALRRAEPIFAWAIGGYDLWLAAAPGERAQADWGRSALRLREQSDRVAEGRLLLALDRPAEAVEALQAALRDASYSEAATLALIEARDRSGASRTAVDDLTGLYKRFPAQPGILRLRAELLERLGDAKRARREAERYRRLVGDGVPALSDEAWAALEDVWDDPAKGGVRALAWADDGAWRNYWNWRSSYTIQAKIRDWCQERTKAVRCGLYALGDTIGWGFSGAQLAHLYRANNPHERDAEPKDTRDIEALTVRIDAGDVEAYLARGDAHARSQDVAAAIADYSKYLERVPDSPEALVKRGAAHVNNNDDTAAATDYEAALRLDGQYQPAYFRRGLLAKRKGDYDAAIRDFDRAIDLHPALPQTYRSRSIARMATGDEDGAIEDFDAVIRLQPAWVYAHLWRHVERARFKGAGREDLEAAAAQFDKSAWPYPIVEMFLGLRTPKDVLEAASGEGQRCEAEYYAAQYHLLQGERDEAIAGQRAAAQACPRTYYEFDLARIELKRLGL